MVTNCETMPHKNIQNHTLSSFSLCLPKQDDNQNIIDNVIVNESLQMFYMISLHSLQTFTTFIAFIYIHFMIIIIIVHMSSSNNNQINK